MSTESALARRSQLFVPANRTNFVTSAGRHRADGVILDLEDSVPAHERVRARKALTGAVPALSQAGYVSIRVNKSFEVLVDDLDAAVASRPAALVLPKVESGVEVTVVDALVRERELRHGIPCGSIEFQVLVETCLGVANVMEIAGSSPRVVSMTLGVEDLAMELEVEPGATGFDMAWAHSRVLMAARAAGIAPYGLMNSLSNFADLGTFTADVARSRAFGFVGAFCIHPSQVAVLNAGFTPSDAEVSRARKVVAALDEAQLKGAASAVLDGRMIDVPVADRARRVLRRAIQIDQQTAPR